MFISETKKCTILHCCLHPPAWTTPTKLLLALTFIPHPQEKKVLDFEWIFTSLTLTVIWPHPLTLTFIWTPLINCYGFGVYPRQTLSLSFKWPWPLPSGEGHLALLFVLASIQRQIKLDTRLTNLAFLWFYYFFPVCFAFWLLFFPSRIASYLFSTDSLLLIWYARWQHPSLKILFVNERNLMFSLVIRQIIIKGETEIILHRFSVAYGSRKYFFWGQSV